MISKLTVISTPKPSSRLISNSPFNLSPSISPLSKSPYFKSRKILLKTTDHSKAQSSNEETPSNISVSDSPSNILDQFLDHILELFSSPECATDYFFLNRSNTLSSLEFFESCESLKITEKFETTPKFFDKNINRSEFLSKLVDKQNIKCKKIFFDEQFKTRPIDEGIFRKKRNIKTSGKPKKENFAKKNVKNLETLTKRRKSGCCNNLLERSIGSKEKKTLNMSLKLNRSIHPLFYHK